MYKGVAQMFGRFKVRGFLAWVLHRTYHVFAMPTWNRKIRIMAGWTWSLLLRREVVALGSLQDPRAEFLAAAGPMPAAASSASPSPGGPASSSADSSSAGHDDQAAATGSARGGSATARR
jgi:NADH dehydrogenase